MLIIYANAASRKLKSSMESSQRIGGWMQYYAEILNDPTTTTKCNDDAAIDHDRQLQAGDVINTQRVVVDGCLFEDNAQGPVSPYTIDGLLFVFGRSNKLTVKNSIFRRNTFASPVKSVRMAVYLLLPSLWLELLYKFI
jgi:hypothetical protein